MLRESLTRHNPVAVATDLRDTLHNDDVPLRPTMRELASVGTTADNVRRVIALRLGLGQQIKCV